MRRRAGCDLLPPDAALDVTVLDSQGREIDRRTVKVNLWSSAEWTWAVPADAPLGHYQTGVSLATGAASNKPSARSSNPRSSVSGTFLVAAYRRPDFRVETTLSGDPAVQGTTLRGTVEAKYLFGGCPRCSTSPVGSHPTPVQNAPGAVRERYPQSRYEIGYLPTDDDPRQLRVPLLQKTEILAADGRLRLPLPTASENDVAYLVHPRERRRRRVRSAHRQSRVARRSPGVSLCRRLAAADVRRDDDRRQRRHRCRRSIRPACQRCFRRRFVAARAVGAGCVESHGTKRLGTTRDRRGRVDGRDVRE